jgi:hypothetical protein
MSFKSLASDIVSSQGLATENIYRCLSACDKCSRYYISQLLQKRFVCSNCKCHAQALSTEEEDEKI